ncbi:MAG TPA: hypothetical protein VK846_17885 [Candidatus Limnocylindria bacterium]|nr:hypothetical protein [Candidatus Limnocylindria bacterium]
MDSPTQPITLEVAQVEELCRHFSAFRHDVNGCLALVVAATELIRYNPSVVARMSKTLIEQPPKIAGKVREFAEQCERTVNLRPASESSWYMALWPRTNLVAGAPEHSVSLAPEAVKTVHNEVVQLGKELTQLGFVISGARSLGSASPENGADAIPNIAEQFTKTALKFEQMARGFEKSMNIPDGVSRRLGSGSPAGPVTLSIGDVTLFQRRLSNLQRDMLEHLAPLIELSRLARHTPQEIQTRAGEFAGASPKISAELANFAAEFDRLFCIVRTS